MKLLNKSFGFLLLVVLGLVISPAYNVRADATEDEIEEDEAVVNEEPGPNAASETDEAEAQLITSSPFVKTSVLFTDPQTTQFPAGKLAKMLIGFQNNGTTSFLVDIIEGSFRYPQDFSYHIQNFSAFSYNKIVEAQKEATFAYFFTPSETFSSRQFGLSINVRYRDTEGKMYMNSLFNDTISVTEPEEGLDGETFFLYIFLAAIAVLVVVLLQHFFTKKIRSKTSFGNGYKQSNGNSYNKDYDEQWIPKEHFVAKEDRSPRVSPRQRKGLKNGNGVSSAGGNSSNDE